MKEVSFVKMVEYLPGASYSLKVNGHTSKGDYSDIKVVDFNPFSKSGAILKAKQMLPMRSKLFAQLGK